MEWRIKNLHGPKPNTSQCRLLHVHGRIIWKLMTSDIMNYYLLLKIPKCASSSFCFPFQEVLNEFMAVLIIVEMSDWQDCGEVAALSELSAVKLVAGIKWRELDRTPPHTIDITKWFHRLICSRVKIQNFQNNIHDYCNMRTIHLVKHYKRKRTHSSYPLDWLTMESNGVYLSVVCGYQCSPRMNIKLQINSI